MEDALFALLDTMFRSIMAVFALEILARINGPKQISQLSFYDYITGITIGSMAAVMAIDDQIPFWLPLASIIVFVLASYAEGKLTIHYLKIRKFVDGVPVVLIANGKLIQEHMKHAHLTVNDLLSEARVAGYFNLHDIAYAVMENSGKISFLPFCDVAPFTKKDGKVPYSAPSLYVNIVIDGELLHDELSAIGKNEEWFTHQCKEHHYGSYKDMLLAIADEQNNLYVWYKNEETHHKKHFI